MNEKKTVASLNPSQAEDTFAQLRESAGRANRQTND
jgi:hypothetical protein